MLMSYERNQNTISSRNIARLLDYLSKNKDYIIVLDRYDIKVVPFDRSYETYHHLLKPKFKG